MTSYPIEQQLTRDALATVASGKPRVQKVMTSLIQHLHDFIRDIEPTEDEFDLAIDFLARTGKWTSETRSEYMLLSDVLGTSMLVDAINHRFATGATESTVTGPFLATAQEVPNGTAIASGSEWERGEKVLLRGRVLDVSGQPIKGAKINLWQTDDLGLYDSQDDNQPDVNLRGILLADDDGVYWCKTVKPLGYQVPTDGPVGELLRACERHAERPAHIHCLVTAPGYRKLVTHVFVAGDKYLAEDATFGVKDSLIAEFNLCECEETAKKYGMDFPFYDVEFDFVLDKQAD